MKQLRYQTDPGPLAQRGAHADGLALLVEQIEAHQSRVNDLTTVNLSTESVPLVRRICANPRICGSCQSSSGTRLGNAVARVRVSYLGKRTLVPPSEDKTPSHVGHGDVIQI